MHDSYWLNILPVMTGCRTSLITWIPGHCGCNWVDLCQLQSSRRDSLGMHLSIFPGDDQNGSFRPAFVATLEESFITLWHLQKKILKPWVEVQSQSPGSNMSLLWQSPMMRPYSLNTKEVGIDRNKDVTASIFLLPVEPSLLVDVSHRWLSDKIIKEN